MSQPTPPEPEPADGDAPLNRAERRAKARRTDPSHVGPQVEPTLRRGRAPRSHTKRH